MSTQHTRRLNSSKPIRRAKRVTNRAHKIQRIADAIVARNTR